MALETAVQRQARQLRDRRLQGIEAIVQRQERVPPERYDHRLLGIGHHRGSRLLRPGLLILNRLAFAPLGNSLGVDAEFLAQRREPSAPPSNRWRAGLRLAIAVLLLGQRA